MVGCHCFCDLVAEVCWVGRPFGVAVKLKVGILCQPSIARLSRAFVCQKLMLCQVQVAPDHFSSQVKPYWLEEEEEGLLNVVNSRGLMFEYH
jgi:hypothetical protein